MAFCAPIRELICNRGREEKADTELRPHTPTKPRSDIKTKDNKPKLDGRVLTKEEKLQLTRREEIRNLRETLRNRKHLLAAQVEIPIRRGFGGCQIKIKTGKSPDASVQNDWEDNLDPNIRKTHKPHTRESLEKFSKFIEAKIERTDEKHKVTSRDDNVQETLKQRLLELQPEKDVQGKKPLPSPSDEEEHPEREGQVESQKPFHLRSRSNTEIKCQDGVCKMKVCGGKSTEDKDGRRRKEQKSTEGDPHKTKHTGTSRSKMTENSKDQRIMDRKKYEINQDREGLAKSPRNPEGPKKKITVMRTDKNIVVTRTREAGSWEEVDTMYKRQTAQEDSRKIPAKGARIVHIATWNVDSRNPPTGFEQLLGLGHGQSPDVIVLGLQEVTMDPKQALMDFLFQDKWSLAVEEILKRRYIEVATKVLVSVALMVYVKRELANSLREIEASCVTTGFGGFYGNKGGVMINFRLLGSRFGIVNSHLPAHDGEINARITDWHTIEAHRKQISTDPRDYLFWMGDLNFRIATDSGWDADEIKRMVQRGMTKEILKKDELILAKQQGLIFRGWNEAEIKFKPTFKMTPGTMGRFNLKRRPAWTDRILFKSETGKEIVNMRYDSVDGFLESDHKPVVAEFQLKLD